KTSGTNTLPLISSVRSIDTFPDRIFNGKGKLKGPSQFSVLTRSMILFALDVTVSDMEAKLTIGFGSPCSNESWRLPPYLMGTSNGGGYSPWINVPRSNSLRRI